MSEKLGEAPTFASPKQESTFRVRIKELKLRIKASANHNPSFRVFRVRVSGVKTLNSTLNPKPAQTAQA